MSYQQYKGFFKMKKILLLIIFFILSNNVISQTKNNLLRGKITEQNSGNRVVAGVQVRAGSANATVSDIDGEFTLTFNKIPPGGETVLSLSYKDWVVVNEKDLITKLPDNPNKQILKLYMCPEQLLAQNRRKYYEISEKQIVAKYTKMLSELNRERDDFAELAKQLDDERDASLKSAYELANKFSHYNFDDRSEIQKQAFNEFKKGNIEKAIQILESVNSKHIIANAKKSKANADSTISQNIKMLVFQADLYVLASQFNKAEITYKIAIDADTTIFDNVFSLASFYDIQNSFDKAILWYKKALKIAKNEQQYSTVLNNLGNIYSDKKYYSTAELVYKRALEINERLALKNPQIYEPDVAMTLINMGILYRAKYDYKMAQSCYIRALEIYDRFAVNDPENIKSHLAIIFNNLGVLYSAMNDVRAAIDAYKKALDIREELAAKNPQSHEPEIAAILSNLGELYVDKNDYVAADSVCKRAFEIYERFANSNPQTYEPYLAVILNNLGILFKNKNDYLAAKSAYNRALEIRERLANINPMAYELDVAETLSNLGILYRDMKDYQGAESTFMRALEIYKRLAESNPKSYQIEVATTLYSLGLLYKSWFRASGNMSYREKGLNCVLKSKKALKNCPKVAVTKDFKYQVKHLLKYFRNVK